MLDFGFYNMDCMEGMKEFPDNYFELAIVDPPYGDGGGVLGRTERDSGRDSTGTSIHKLNNAGKWATDPQRQMGGGSRHYAFGARKNSSTYQDRRNMGEQIRKKIVAWDVAPGEDYFKELFRISRNQIIWGGNYFQLPPSRGFLIWRKTNVPQDFSMAMAEYAWMSFQSNAKVFDFSAVGQEGRFHPTQKPVALYKWILKLYANKGDKILDTHVGSASSLIACYDLGFDYVGFEIDEEYYRLAKERLDAEMAQIRFDWRLP